MLTIYLGDDAVPSADAVIARPSYLHGPSAAAIMAPHSIMGFHKNDPCRAPFNCFTVDGKPYIPPYMAGDQPASPTTEAVIWIIDSGITEG